MSDIDTTNRLMVAGDGTSDISVMRAGIRLTATEAKVAAAWLLVMADTAEVVHDEEGPSFEECLNAVRNT